MSARVRIDLRKWQSALVVTTLAVGIAVLSFDAPRLHAQNAGQPYAALLPATAMAFPNETDSNSPAVWALEDGVWTLSLFNSVAGSAELSRGPSVGSLADHGDVHFNGPAPHGGFWIESVIRDADSWYGFYHNEREDVVCEGSGKVWPRIGAARSDDRGATWTDLGPVLETPLRSVHCQTNNRYFVGGAGDFSVTLDADRNFAYFYYTQYAELSDAVGVSVARMAWADRDQPAGRLDVWSDGAWLPPSERPEPEDPTLPAIDVGAWNFPLATPILRAANRWDNDRNGVDVLWGPSVHWNTAIGSYVMLLNKAVSNGWDQGGVFVSFNDRLDDPNGWSAPVLLARTARWYPQVIGLDPTVGTDSIASGVARFFTGGKSEHFIVFGRR